MNIYSDIHGTHSRVAKSSEEVMNVKLKAACIKSNDIKIARKKKKNNTSGCVNL